jgi:transposase
MKCKRDNDARSLDHHSLELMRQQAVTASKSGVSVRQIAATFGINVRSVYRWLAHYANGGHAALLAKEIPGRPPKLNRQQFNWLVQVLTDKTPAHFELEPGLWTLALMGEVIKREFAIQLSVSGLGRVMKLIGFSNAKPFQDVSLHSPELLSQWQQNIYTDLRKKAKKVGAQIYFSNHASTPEGHLSSLNMISAVSATGHHKFMLNEGSITADVFIEFLKRLLISVKKPIYLIVDGINVCYSVKVSKFVRDQQGMLELFFFPTKGSTVKKNQRLSNSSKLENGINSSALRLNQKLKQIAWSIEHFTKQLGGQIPLNDCLQRSLEKRH